jgi:hypothetical protein
MITLNQGMVVAVRCWWGEHWGIVANDPFGRTTVVSNRGMKGGVTEEPWSEVVGSAEWRVLTDLVSDLPAYFVVERARSKISTRYSFSTWNCQDLVYWALGLQPQSPQREMALGLLSLVCLGVIVRMAARAA